MAQKCEPTFITTFEPIDVCPLCVEQNCHGPQFVTTAKQQKIWLCTPPFILMQSAYGSRNSFPAGHKDNFHHAVGNSARFYAAFDITRKRCFSPAPQFCTGLGIYTSQRTTTLTRSASFPSICDVFTLTLSHFRYLDQCLIWCYDSKNAKH